MSKKYFLILGVIFFFGKSVFSQMGCTDPQAINFDAAAMTNDGSCQYATTVYALQEIAILPSVIYETSGLAYFDNQLWTHNDGGNEDKIYQIDTLTGEVLQSVIIANSSNEDWEDLAEDETHLYLGDFGNNDGNRMDLKIYKFPKSQLTSGIATAEIIEFSYEDQTDFSVNHNSNDYDCEAFFYLNDSLHLFSKNWVDQKTRHYIVPAQAGNYVATLKEEVDVQGLITGSDIDDDGVVALIGYNPSGVNIMWLYFDYQGTNFFSGNKRKISLGLALDNSQTEAIVFRQDGKGFISSEKFATLQAKLLSFESEQWTNGVSTAITEINKADKKIQVFPNPFSNNVNVLLEKEGDFEISLYDVNGILLKKEMRSSRGLVDWNLAELNLRSGLYIVSVKSKDEIWFRKIFKEN